MTKRAEPSDSAPLDTPHSDKKSKTSGFSALLNTREFSSLDWWNRVHDYFTAEAKTRKRGVYIYLVGVQYLRGTHRILGSFPIKLCRAVIANLRWYLSAMESGALVLAKNTSSLIAGSLQEFQDTCTDSFKYGTANFIIETQLGDYSADDFNQLLALSRTTEITWWKSLRSLFIVVNDKPDVNVDALAQAITALYTSNIETLRAMPLCLSTALSRELRCSAVSEGGCIVSQPLQTLAHVGRVAAELKNACMREFIE